MFHHQVPSEVVCGDLVGTRRRGWVQVTGTVALLASAGAGV